MNTTQDMKKLLQLMENNDPSDDEMTDLQWVRRNMSINDRYHTSRYDYLIVTFNGERYRLGFNTHTGELDSAEGAENPGRSRHRSSVATESAIRLAIRTRKMPGHKTFESSTKENKVVADEAVQIDESRYDPDVLKEIADELEEFLDQMKNNIHEMSRLLVPVPRDIRERAKAYWIGHIKAALDAEEFGFSSMSDVASTIKELREYGNHE